MAMPLKGHRPPVTLFDKNENAIDSVLVATVRRLCVDATFGGFVPIGETDDNNIAANQVGLLTIPLCYGFDGTVWRRMRLKSAALATSDERLMHLSTMAVLAMVDGGAPAGSQEIPLQANRDVSAAATETGYYLPTRASVCGLNSAAGAGSQSVPVEARAASDDSKFGSALVGLLVNSRMSAWSVQTGDWSILNSDAPLNVYGRTIAVGALYANAVCVGVDNTGSPVFQPVEAKGATSASSSNNEADYSLHVNQSRESAFAASLRGHRFAGCNQTPGTELTTPSTAYDATKPSVMWRINTADVRAIMRTIQFMVSTVGGAAPVWWALVLDTADRYSSVGTAITPQNQNEESSDAAKVKMYETPTATAAGGGTRVLQQGVAANTQGVLVTIDMKDGVLLGLTAATLMLYVWTGTSAVKVVYDSEWEEAW